MNIDNFRIARGWVAEQKHFDMRYWLRTPRRSSQGFIREENEKFPCGTVACLAGTIAIRAGETGSVRHISKSFLGLSRVQADKLFERPRFYGKETMRDVTKDDVLAKLDEIITSGEFK